MIVAAQKVKSERSYAEKNEICDWSAVAGGAYGGGCGTHRKLGACPEQLGAAAAAYTCAAGSWWGSRKRGDPPAWGKTRETTPAWLVGGHNAKILYLKTGQLPSLEVVQGMQSASKQSGGVLVPSTPRGMVLAIQPRCKLLADDQIERGTISLHWSYDERGERGGCRL